MNHAQVLTALIDHVNASDKPVNISWDEVAQWSEGLLKHFVAHRLMATDVNTKSLACLGCEHHCTMNVLLTEDAKRAFIVCDHSEMQSQMGRIKVPLERLQQWQVSTKQFARFIATKLGFDAKPVYTKESASYKLGMLKSKAGRRWVTLQEWPLRLEIAGHSVPLKDLLFFRESELVIDVERIQSLLASGSSNIGKAYTPNTNRQETRKMATQAMCQNWRDEYHSLRIKHPGKPDTWYSNKIAKMNIAQGKQSETIRKQMKK